MRIPIRRFLALIPILIASHAASADTAAREKTLPFWDLAQFDDWENLELVQTPPRQISEATYTDPVFPDASMVFPFVWREQSGNWRMIYSLKWNPFTLMVATSADGVRWTPLATPEFQTEGGKLAPHHIFTFPHGQGSGVYRDPIAADGFPFKIFGRQDPDGVFPRALADPGHRWHAIAKAEGKKRYMSEAVTLGSRDGLRWQILPNSDWACDDWSPEPPVFAFFRESDRTHVLTARPGWGDRRVVLRETRDFRTWTEPALLFQPDVLDTAGPVGFYGMPVMRSGPGYVGVLWTFRNSSSVPVDSYNRFFGDFDSQLTFSYDGRSFHRGLRQPFIALNPIPEHGCAQIRVASLVKTDTELRFYSEAHRGAHGRERGLRQSGREPMNAVLLHTLRKDGFMHVRSRGDFARLQTKPILLRDATVALNAIASYGEVRFQVTNVKSEPLPGLAYADCIPLRQADALRHELRWKQASLAEHVGKVVRLEISFRQANLFALYGRWHFIDAQDLWMIEDGKPVAAKRFDEH